jgi:co-chaperonin GroES (HSP10)
MSETIALPETELILPPGVKAPEVDREYEEASPENKAKALPDPKGWRLLCALIDPDDAYEGSGLLKADKTKEIEELTSPVLFVIKLGPSAYDAEKFPEGAWCKEGDFVITRPYTGTRLKIHGKEFRLINDDQVEATVEDPRGITRV